jgi:hypothetical protein
VIYEKKHSVKPHASIRMGHQNQEAFLRMRSKRIIFTTSFDWSSVDDSKQYSDRMIYGGEEG